MFSPRVIIALSRNVHHLPLLSDILRILLHNPLLLLALLPISEPKRCSKCLLPETAPQIHFDADGECNFCKSHQKIETLGEEALLKLLEKYRGKNGRYECLVPVSGGRDSTYTLLKVAKDYKMKVLAVNYENPFTDPQAKENIKNATETLKVDLVSFKSPQNIHARVFKNSLRTWCKKPSPGAFPLLCLGCKLMWWDIIHIAKKYNIHCVIGGLNRFEDSTYKKVALGISEKESWEKTFIKAFSGMFMEIIKNPGYVKLSFLPYYIRAYLFGDPYALGCRLFYRKIELTDLFYYLDWNEKEVLSRISSELKWEMSPNASSSWRFDCKVTDLKDYINKNLLGMTEKDDFYSKLIREGKISREEAIKRIEKENMVSFENIADLLAITDISFDFLNKTIQSSSQAKKAFPAKKHPHFHH